MFNVRKLEQRVEALAVRYFAFLGSKGKNFNFALALVCCVLLETIDVLITDSSLTFLYVFPIAFCSWFSGKRRGFMIVALSSIFLTIDTTLTKPLLVAWNSFSTFGLFIVIMLLVHSAKMLLQNEQRLARTDGMTGVMNYLAFSEVAVHEIRRQRRNNSYLSLAFIDLDNFKRVNDLFGHQKGDQVLIEVAKCLVKNLRRTDFVARYGGDEFLILLPDTSQVAARVVIGKVQKSLLDAIDEKLGVTFSIGVVTCSQPLEKLDELIALADKQMYEVKKTGKNNAKFILV
jgi:diguanylate cyclase (GGDEF)-like protein